MMKDTTPVLLMSTCTVRHVLDMPVQSVPAPMFSTCKALALCYASMNVAAQSKHASLAWLLGFHNKSMEGLPHG